MNTKDDLTGSDLIGKDAYLPDGQRVLVEEVFQDGRASVRQLEGECRGMVAVCAIASLQPS